MLAIAAAIVLASACSDGNDHPMERAPSFDAGVVVTDADAVGAVGDDLLSLAEAIQLANGTLTRGGLSNAEASRINGDPGATSRDEIRFDVAGGAVRFPLQIQEKPAVEFAVLTPRSPLPALVGNDGDTITGEGIRFTNGADDAVDTVNVPRFYNGAPLGGLALRVASSDFTLSGVTFERFVQGIQVQPETVDGLTNVAIAGNRFHNGGGIAFSATTSEGHRGSLSAVRVEDNEFLGPRVFDEHFPSMFHTAVSVMGASAATASSAKDEIAVVVSDVSISGNTIDQFGSGVQVQPLQAIFGANAHARVTGVRIENNRIIHTREAVDPPIYVWGAVNVGGTVSDVAVSDIAITDNTVSGNGYLVFVPAVEVLLAGSTPSSDVTMDGVSITGNTLGPIVDCVVGITTITAFPELGGSTVSNASMKNVEIADNTVTGCDWGALATPVYNVGAPDASSGNTLQGLRYERNRIEQASMGIVIAGGTLAADDFGGVAGVESNSVSGVVARDNRFAATDLGILLAGGFASGSASGYVSQNTVEVDAIEGNEHSDDNSNPVCQLRQDAGDGAGATVTGNQVLGASACE